MSVFGLFGLFGLFGVAGLPYNELLYAIPLIVSVSLVYGATRDERMSGILSHAYRSAVMIVSFLGTMFALMYFISWFT